jgi:hypothetical protein
LSRPARHVVLASLIAVALLFAVDFVVFRTILYRGVLDPESPTGAFEQRLREVDALHGDPSHEVLVLGDSRMLEAFSASIASQNRAALHFINGAVAGTDPRCWFYFLRGADPTAHGYRAIVVPLDTYNDDDTSLGADDAADRVVDVDLVIFRVGVADVFDFPASFASPATRQAALAATLVHMLALKRDAGAFLANPAARLAAIAAHPAGSHETSPAYDGLHGSLEGLAVDANGAVSGMNAVADAERAPLMARLLHDPHPSASYAAYRRRWLGAVLERYRGSGTRVVFVRFPSLPLVLHPVVDDPQSVVHELAPEYGGALLLPPSLFSDLERPRYFADHENLNSEGRRIFSRVLGEQLAALP